MRNLIPTQSEWGGCSDLRWFETRRRIPRLHRGFGCPPCGRQSDVTGTVSAPVTSPHSKSGDVMTSPDRVYRSSQALHSARNTGGDRLLRGLHGESAFDLHPQSARDAGGPHESSWLTLENAQIGEPTRAQAQSRRTKHVTQSIAQARARAWARPVSAHFH